MIVETMSDLELREEIMKDLDSIAGFYESMRHNGAYKKRLKWGRPKNGKFVIRINDWKSPNGNVYMFILKTSGWSDFKNGHVMMSTFTFFKRNNAQNAIRLVYDKEGNQIGDKYYRVNDKVIQLVNDIDNNVFNGDIGYIKEIEFVDKKAEITIDYMGNKVTYKNGEFDRFSLAYAISIHKSQGSEYDNVVIVLAHSFKRMFYNKLIYTAVTRAKESLMIIGSIDSFNSSVQTLYADNRNTLMKNV